MSPRTGRPPKENPKDIRIQIRLDTECLRKLDECVKRDSSTRSEVIREGIDLMYSRGGKK
nr:MAG TPA: Alginate and motility regulator [Bacteriophage sp.]